MSLATSRDGEGKGRSTTGVRDPGESRAHAPSASPVGRPARGPGLKRALKDQAKRGLRRAFELGQRLGLDVLPRHFYSQVPDIRDLKSDPYWKQPRSMVGVQGAEPSIQFDFVEACCSVEVAGRLRSEDLHARACAINGEAGFGVPDAEFLYGFIRTIQPRRIVQVGCGVSTAVMLVAAEDAGYRPELVCVEPFPTEFLTRSAQDGRIELVRARAQDVPREFLTRLGDEGLLFVDSTHTVKPGSEVNRLILEVVPRLEVGGWVHFHDIYFPYDYQRGLIDDELFFSNESVLLHALLINNRALTVRAALSMLHYADPARLGRSLPGYRPAPNDQGLRAGAGHFPASAYLQVCGE